MNARIVIFITAILLVSCISHKPDNLTIKISAVKEINPIFEDENRLKFYSLNLDLINNTDSIFKFWTNSCSWQSNWIFNVKTITLYVDCPKNVPIISYIKPHDRITYNAIIDLNDTVQIRSIEAKVGFVVVKQKEVTKESDFIEILRGKIKNKKDIIWSESFKLSN